MKILPLLLIAATASYGATPTFQSFNLADFSTNGYIISIVSTGNNLSSKQHGTVNLTNWSNLSTNILSTKQPASANLSNFATFSTNFFYPSNNPAAFITSTNLAFRTNAALGGFTNATEIRMKDGAGSAVDVLSTATRQLYNSVGNPAFGFDNARFNFSTNLVIGTNAIHSTNRFQVATPDDRKAFEVGTNNSVYSRAITNTGNIDTATVTASGSVTATGGLALPSGSNRRAGTAVLVGGTVTVNNTSVAATDLLVLTRITAGGTLGIGFTYTFIASTSFTINAVDSAGALLITDTSTVGWILVSNP
jgi:hypothetical protein